MKYAFNFLVTCSTLIVSTIQSGEELKTKEDEPEIIKIINLSDSLLKAQEKTKRSLDGLKKVKKIFKKTFFIKPEFKTKSFRGVKYNIKKNLSTFRDSLVAEAVKHLGKPYVWATRGPATFDCSGFTSYCYKQFNINITPSSIHQAKLGVEVPIDSAKPGDLVFFQGTRRPKPQVCHVAMLLENNDSTVSIIHANGSARGIEITEIKKNGKFNPRWAGKWWIENFIYVKKII